jgi:hypothetical protein
MFKIYIIGAAVLLIAIAANILASVFGFMSWYDAISSIQKNGWSSFKQWKMFDYLWLLLLYPFLLGIGYVVGNKLYEWIVK